MNLDNGKFSLAYKVPRFRFVEEPYIQQYMQHIRKELLHKFMDNVFMSVVDSGTFHVLKLDFMRDDSEFDFITFYLKVHHSLAEQRQVIMTETVFSVPETAKSCCQWCGNVLSLDERGGCSACGGNPSVVFNNTMKYKTEFAYV